MNSEWKSYSVIFRYLCNYISWKLSYFCFWLINHFSYFSEAFRSHIFIRAPFKRFIHLSVRYCIRLPPSLNPSFCVKVLDGHSKVKMLSVRFSPNYVCFLFFWPKYPATPACIHTYIYIYMYIYTHTHTYIHTYIFKKWHRD